MGVSWHPVAKLIIVRMSKLDHQNKVSTTFKNILNVIEYQSKNCDLKSWHGFGLHICDKKTFYSAMFVVHLRAMFFMKVKQAENCF